MLYYITNYGKIKIPPEAAVSRCCLHKKVVSLPRQASGGVKPYCCFPRTQTRKGGCLMTLTETIALLGLLGGAVFVTFQISWAIFKEIHNNKK